MSKEKFKKTLEQSFKDLRSKMDESLNPIISSIMGSVCEAYSAGFHDGFNTCRDLVEMSNNEEDGEDDE